MMFLLPDFLFGVFLIFLGLAILALGWKIHQQIVGITGFISGLVFGDFIGSQLFRFDFFLLKLTLIIISSIAFSLLFFIYMRFSIGITSGIIGAIIISGFTSSKTLIGWALDYAIFQTNYNYAALILSFIIFGIAGYRFYKLGYIILSTGIGSILFSYGGIFVGLWNYDRQGIFLLLSLMLGIIIQLSQEGAIREQRMRINSIRFDK